MNPSSSRLGFRHKTIEDTLPNGAQGIGVSQARRSFMQKLGILIGAPTVVSLAACAPNTREKITDATTKILSQPPNIEKGTTVEYVLQYSPGLTNPPTVVLGNIPAGVTYTQVYDKGSGQVKVFVTVPSTISATQLNIEFSTRARAYSIDPTSTITPIMDSNGPELSKESNTTASIKQGTLATYSLQFDKVIASATLDGNELPEGSVINGSNISLQVPATTQVGVTKPVLIVRDANGKTTSIILTLNTTDGVGPEWTNAKDFPTKLAQGEERQVQMIFNEPISAVPSISAGFTILESTLSPDGKVVTMKIKGRNEPDTYTGIMIALDTQGNQKQYNFVTEIVDKTPPVLTLKGSPGAVTSNTTANFILTSTEELSKLDYSTDGGTTWNQSALTDAIQLNNLSDGTQNIRIRGTDKYNNLSTELDYTWMVDTKSPVFLSGDTTWYGTQGGGQVSGALLRFKESINTVKWVETSGSGINLGNISIEDSNVKYDMSFDASTPPGTYTFSVSAKDSAGNEAIVPITLTVYKQNTEVVVGDIAGPDTLDSTDTAKEYSVTPVDPDGIKSVTAQIDGVDVAVTLTSGTYKISTPAGLSVGAHGVNFTVIAKKPDGTDETPSTITKIIEVVEVDTVPPQIQDFTGKYDVVPNQPLIGQFQFSKPVKAGTYDLEVVLVSNPAIKQAMIAEIVADGTNLTTFKGAILDESKFGIYGGLDIDLIFKVPNPDGYLSAPQSFRTYIN